MLAVRVLAYALVSEIPQHQPNGRGRATVPSRRHEYSSPWTPPPSDPAASWPSTLPRLLRTSRL